MEIIPSTHLQFIGFLAAILTTISLIPQVAKCIKTKKTRDLSTPTYVLLATGLVMWTVYGFARGDYPVFLANGFSFLLVATILFLKVKYR